MNNELLENITEDKIKKYERRWIPITEGKTLLGGIYLSAAKFSTEEAYYGPGYTERILGNYLRNSQNHLIGKGK
jgi:hypothetical protein